MTGELREGQTWGGGSGRGRDWREAGFLLYVPNHSVSEVRDGECPGRMASPAHGRPPRVPARSASRALSCPASSSSFLFPPPSLPTPGTSDLPYREGFFRRSASKWQIIRTSHTKSWPIRPVRTRSRSPPSGLLLHLPNSTSARNSPPRPRFSLPSASVSPPLPSIALLSHSSLPLRLLAHPTRDGKPGYLARSEHPSPAHAARLAPTVRSRGRMRWGTPQHPSPAAEALSCPRSAARISPSSFAHPASRAQQPVTGPRHAVFQTCLCLCLLSPPENLCYAPVVAARTSLFCTSSRTGCRTRTRSGRAAYLPVWSLQSLWWRSGVLPGGPATPWRP